MHTGMLWFDNSKLAPLEKITKGIDYYQKKYGRSPDMVLVHPSYAEKTELHEELKAGEYTVVIKREAGDITVKFHLRLYRPVLPGHIWIGIEDKG